MVLQKHESHKISSIFMFRCMRVSQFDFFSQSCFFFHGQEQSRSQSFVPLDQRSENESYGSNHYERTKEITEFWLSGSLRICIYGACLKWLLPELSFSDRWSRGTKLWERDWAKKVSKDRVLDFSLFAFCM